MYEGTVIKICSVCVAHGSYLSYISHLWYVLRVSCCVVCGVLLRVFMFRKLTMEGLGDDGGQGRGGMDVISPILRYLKHWFVAIYVEVVHL